MILGTVKSVTAEGVTVLIDGEETTTTKKYQSSVPVNPDDRVMIEEFGDSYQIVSKVRNLQGFDTNSDDAQTRYIQLQPFRTYLLVNVQWYVYQGNRTNVKKLWATLVATGARDRTPEKYDLTGSASSSPFSTYSNCQIRYSRSEGSTHVAIIEL